MQINLMPDLSLLAVMVIFIMNYLVVRKFFLEPINRVMEERERENKSAEEKYYAAMQQFSEATAHVESQIHGAKRDAAAIREKLRGEAAAHRAAVVEKTHGEAKQLVAGADEKLQTDVVAARTKIATDSESLAHLAAERILGRAV